MRSLKCLSRQTTGVSFMTHGGSNIVSESHLYFPVTVVRVCILQHEVMPPPISLLSADMPPPIFLLSVDIPPLISLLSAVFHLSFLCYLSFFLFLFIPPLFSPSRSNCLHLCLLIQLSQEQRWLWKNGRLIIITSKSYQTKTLSYLFFGAHSNRFLPG